MHENCTAVAWFYRSVIVPKNHDKVVDRILTPQIFMRR